MSNKPPLLNDPELMGPGIAKILEYFDNRLTKLREDNDSFTADIHIRGRIAEIKAFQKAIHPKKQKQSNSIVSGIN